MANEKRLIDANAALDLLVKEFNRKLSLIHAGQTQLDCIAEGFCSADYIIKNMPAVDAVEVARGRWIPVPSSDMATGKAYKCSECNKMRYGSYMPNYCQCCGANMKQRTTEQ